MWRCHIHRTADDLQGLGCRFEVSLTHLSWRDPTKNLGAADAGLNNLFLAPEGGEAVGKGMGKSYCPPHKAAPQWSPAVDQVQVGSEGAGKAQRRTTSPVVDPLCPRLPQGRQRSAFISRDTRQSQAEERGCSLMGRGSSC